MIGQEGGEDGWRRRRRELAVKIDGATISNSNFVIRFGSAKNWEGVNIEGVVRSAECREDDASATGSVVVRCCSCRGW